MFEFHGVAEWWEQNDFVVAGVFITLLVLSLVSWTVMICKAWQFLCLERLERRLIVELRQRDNCCEMAQLGAAGVDGADVGGSA